jgi:CRP/FNR family transcriptional regulator
VTTFSPAVYGVTPPDQPHQGTPGDEFSLRRSLPDELALGRRKLITAFRASPPRNLKPDELLATPGRYSSEILRLRAGWACQSCNLSNGDSAIIDVYVPGDVIGVDRLLRTRSVGELWALTSLTLDVIAAEDGLLELIADPSIALYLCWLLGQRQGRADRHLAANTRLDSLARLAMMILDFYTRLRRRRLITTATYSLPLTQTQIGDYLGLSTVHVNRVLRSLRDDRVISLEKNCVTILDLERLAMLSHHEDLTNSTARSTSAAAELSVATSIGSPHDPVATPIGSPHDPVATPIGSPYDPFATLIGSLHDPVATSRPIRSA